jgi:hypothetical protein
MEYQEAVSRGKRVCGGRLSQGEVNWQLGDIARQVKTGYAEETIQLLANEIGVRYKTLLNCRRVAEAYRKGERSPNSPWVVHAIFAAEPDRAELVRKPWTAREAKKEIARRRNDKMCFACGLSAEVSELPGIPAGKIICLDCQDKFTSILTDMRLRALAQQVIEGEQE